VNYTELQTAVEDTTENTFSATDFALLTKLSEQKIYNAVQLPNLRKTSNLTLVVSNDNLNLPTDFLAVYSLAVVLASGAYEFLLNKDVNFIRAAYPTPTATGTPRYYALDGTSSPLVQQIILGPTPNAALTAELNYFYYPESIVTATNTWLGDNFDSVLFNAIMVEAARFMKQEQDIVAMYTQQFQESLLLLKNLGAGKNTTDQYRAGQARVKAG
jgi:hypothetical protein